MQYNTLGKHGTTRHLLDLFQPSQVPHLDTQNPSISPTLYIFSSCAMPGYSANDAGLTLQYNSFCGFNLSSIS
jgi:hypothetical protein